MTLLEDARRLNELHPVVEAGGFRFVDHSGCYGPDCPHLVLPRIIAALEAAELVTIAAEEERILFGVRAGSQLVAALEKLDEVLDS